MKDIRKVSNDGTQVKSKRVIRFLTTNGFRTPREIWVGYDNYDTELTDTTKKGVKNAIDMNNRVFAEHPELLNIK